MSLMKGEYRPAGLELVAEGQYGNLQVDASGSLKVVSTPRVATLSPLLAGAASTYGKIGAIADAASIYVVADLTDTPANYVDWVIKSAKQFNYQFFRAVANPLACTLTLTDATAVDNTDTCVINGLTFTAVTSGAVAASREYNLGASNAAAAVNLAALLTNATYGVPGIEAIVITSPTTTDVLTCTFDEASTLQFAQGTSAANEIAFADATVPNLFYQAALVEDIAIVTPTYGGFTAKQTVDGWDYAVLKFTNDSGDASTVTPLIYGLPY